MVVCLMHRIEGFYDGFAVDRSLAELVSGYRNGARLEVTFLKPRY